MSKDNILGSKILISAAALTQEVRRAAQDAEREMQAKDAHSRRAKSDPLMPDVEEMQRAAAILRGVKKKVTDHVSNRWPGARVTILEIDWRSRDEMYAGHYVAPPAPCRYEHMRGHLRAVYKVCQAAGLKPRACMADASAGTGIDVTIDIGQFRVRKGKVSRKKVRAQV